MSYKLVDKGGLPPAIFKAIQHRPYNKGDGVKLSVSQLINPPYLVQQEARLGDSLEVDAMDLIYALDGSAMHAVFEWAKPAMDAEWPDRYIFEKRYFAEVEGWKISGQIDLIDLHTATIEDYKNTSYWVSKFGPKKEWEQQLNCYMWLAHKNGIKIKDLVVHARYRDWSKMKSLRGEQDYPSTQYQPFKISAWSLSEAEAFVKDRVQKHQEAEKKDLKAIAPCTMEERWGDVDGYRIVVGEEKKARKRVATKQEAAMWIASNLSPQDMAKVQVVEKRTDPTRCIAYCAVRHHCPVGKEWAK